MTRQQTAEPDAVQDALRAATPEKLLSTFAQFTHRLHGPPSTDPREREAAASVRAQRDMVQAEILRRMGGE